MTFGDRFTKQAKLARDRNSKTAPMVVEISEGDLLTTHKLKNTETTSHLHIDQHNIPSAAQISEVANKKCRCLLGVGTYNTGAKYFDILFLGVK